MTKNVGWHKLQQCLNKSGCQGLTNQSLLVTIQVNFDVNFVILKDVKKYDG